MASNDDEVYYCGHCNRQQPAEPGKEKCRVCGRQTVSWFIDRESDDVARRRWKAVNG